jgi:hypothetical protein
MRNIDKRPANGRYIWCYVYNNTINPEGNGKSLGYALTIKHHQSNCWKLFKLVSIPNQEMRIDENN